MARTLEITPNQQRVLAAYARHEVARDEAAEMLQVSTKTVLRWFKRLGLEYAERECYGEDAQGRRRAAALAAQRDTVVADVLYAGLDNKTAGELRGMCENSAARYVRAFRRALRNPPEELPATERNLKDWAQHAVRRLAAKYPDIHPAVVELAKRAVETEGSCN